MQFTTRFHDAVAHTMLQEAELLFFTRRARFTPPMACSIPMPIDEITRWLAQVGAYPLRRSFLWLDDGRPVEETAPEAQLLSETTPVRQAEALELSQALILGLLNHIEFR